ncbi:MAG TPA: uroporphyrinogen decarboxylase family protein [Oscillospiraceae bacterium]|nr:uroporphyrinogen decarboxylase family protein [Oscillospiraceae bacterium]HPF56488.1 uroporphyrinogen decarboxylase family protein [Clostridiales bacterium]HPK35259.1 uroporphyrinogen decarboxylase family protein [Oscillospiraceae bacterium]HPR75452.1 uroporphyrinogen decarboxylase family protein [Oscillospiraceae bacterium]
MNPKELLFAVLQHKETPRTPWVPFAGAHAGKLVGYDAEEVLTDGDKLFKALTEVNRLYKPDGQPVVFDLQIEAEILGCELVWTKDGPPSVKTHPLSETTQIPCRCTLPDETDGRIPMVLDVMRRMKKEVGDTTALYGLICGPFTLASHLRGNDIFMDMFDDEEYVKNLLGYCADAAKRMIDMYVAAGMNVIAVVDPLVSQVSPAHFEEFLDAPFKELFDYIRAKKVFSSFFVCGDATKNIEVMCKTGPDSISIDENVNIVAAKQITDKYNITIGGNIPLTTVMLHGTQQDNMKCVVDILDSIENKKNLIIAPGCDMPYNVPVENAIGAAQAVLQTEETRKMIENYVAVKDDIEIILPDYANLPRPLVEVFTLDSATCAACTYMLDAAQKAKDHFDDKIDMVEYKYTIKENIARCIKMGVKNLPSIYINGQLKFSSIIPSREELFGAIEAVM